MNKADLSAKWSKYCNTNQLVDDVMQLLRKYHHNNSEHGVCVLLDKYFTNKEPLIRLFATSPNYIGDMRISLVKSFDRQPNINEINNFFNKHQNMFCGDKLLQFVDESGNRMRDYLNTGKTAMSVFKLSDTKANDKLQNFHHNTGALKDSYYRSRAFKEYLRVFQGNPYSKMQGNFYSGFHKNSPMLTAGTKTSRAFNKVCVFYGFDKEEDYNKVFAQYADLVSDLARDMNFIISLNPLDYLTMSFGVSWESCHNIRSGGWKGGCLSYMLDSTSIITFVVNGIEGPIHQIPKVYRQMFHYDGDMFVQSRLYPQGNDGAVNLYDKFRNIVTEEFGNMLNLNNEWISCNAGYATYNHIESRGSHYRDYNNNYNCRTFYHHSKENDAQNHMMTIGHESICVHCGKPVKEHGLLAHFSCNVTLDDWA